MAATYTPIASITLGAAASTVTFSSIPGTYTDLVIVTIGFTSTGVDYYLVRVNSDSGTNYSRTYLYNSNGSAASNRETNIAQVYGSTGTSSTNLGTSIHHFMNYSNTTTNKTILRRGSLDGIYSPQLEVGLWRSTAAINTISLISGTGNFGVNSRFDLYGILGANA